MKKKIQKNIRAVLNFCKQWKTHMAKLSSIQFKIARFPNYKQW